MIKKEINSKVQAKRVARELAKDLHEVLDIYSHYQVKIEERPTFFYVRVMSQFSSSIITCSANANIMEMAQIYMRVYSMDINYHLDAVKWVHDDITEFIPAFVFCVNFHEKEEEKK